MVWMSVQGEATTHHCLHSLLALYHVMRLTQVVACVFFWESNPTLHLSTTQHLSHRKLKLEPMKKCNTCVRH